MLANVQLFNYTRYRVFSPVLWGFHRFAYISYVIKHDAMMEKIKDFWFDYVEPPFIFCFFLYASLLFTELWYILLTEAGISETHAHFTIENAFFSKWIWLTLDIFA